MKTPPITTPRSFDSFDSFDQALVDELRHVVEARDLTPARAPRRRRPALAAASIAAVAATAFGLSTLGASSAYAVVLTQSGAIQISINRLADASGLKEELASYGVDADVNYEAAGPATVSPKELAPVAGGSAPDGLTFTDQAPSIGSPDENGAAASGDQQNSPCGDPAHPPMTAALRGDEYVITIPVGSPLVRSESVLKISTSGGLDNTVAGIVVSYTVDGQQCGFGSVSAGNTPTP